MRFKLSRFIVILTFLYLPIDTLNGLLIRNLGVSISPVYKAIILILILIYLIRQNETKFIKWIIIFFGLISLHYAGGILTGEEVAWAMKFLAIIFSFLFFKQTVLSDKAENIFKLAKISFWIIGFNIIIGLMGYGYAQYARDDIGTRGLFFAGNELGVLLLVVSLILLSKCLINNNSRSYFFYAFTFLIMATTLTTKTAIFGQTLIIFVLPFIHLRQTQKKFIIKRTSLKLVGFAIIMLSLGLPFLVNYVLYEMNLISRISFWSDRVDISTLIFSGRNLRALDIYEFLQKKSTFLNNLFGYGYENLIRIIDGDVAEIDLIDIFMVFGIVGVVSMYGFLLKRFYFKVNPQNFRYQPYIKFGVLLLIVLSCSSGHVLNSGLAGIMIGAFLALQYLDFRKLDYGQD